MGFVIATVDRGRSRPCASTIAGAGEHHLVDGRLDADGDLVINPHRVGGGGTPRIRQDRLLVRLYRRRRRGFNDDRRVPADAVVAGDANHDVVRGPGRRGRTPDHQGNEGGAVSADRTPGGG